MVHSLITAGSVFQSLIASLMHVFSVNVFLLASISMHEVHALVRGLSTEIDFFSICKGWSGRFSASQISCSVILAFS